MTNYGKWDAYVAGLSDDEDAASAAPTPQTPVASIAAPEPAVVKAGHGNALRPDGTIQHLDWRPGNARGNALSTNSDIKSEFYIEQYSWDENREAGVVHVAVPLKPLGNVLQEQVRCAYSDSSFSLRIHTDKGETHMLEVDDLPCGGVVAEESSFRVEYAGGKNQESTNQKSQPECRWGVLGRVRKEMKRPLVTISDYSWADGKKSCRVWIKVPGVHKLPAASTTSRFRELSFDVTVANLQGKDYQFSITELPMEVVVDQCYHEVLEDQVKIFIRKWAKTGWFKLTNLDGR